jgi:hypothetical protein
LGRRSHPCERWVINFSDSAQSDGYGGAVSLTDDFRSAVDGEERVDGPELLPTLLAEACVKVLHVGGAGLSLTRALGSPRALRVPLGASDETAAHAERLQTSLGEGPCLTAAASAEPLMADAVGIADRWPVFHAELIAQTPFRSVASLPVRWGEGAEPVGALDLYLTSPDAPCPRLLSGGIAETIAEMLFTSTATAERRGTWLPAWMASPRARQRMNVWVAVGILNGHAGLDSTDALALLRAYAFGHGLTLDDLAKSMSNQRLDPETVLGFN